MTNQTPSAALALALFACWSASSAARADDGPRVDQIRCEGHRAGPELGAGVQRVVVLFAWAKGSEEGAAARELLSALPSGPGLAVGVATRAEGFELPQAAVYESITVDGRSLRADRARVFAGDGEQLYAGDPRKPGFRAALVRALRDAPGLGLGAKQERVQRLAEEAREKGRCGKALRGAARLEASGSQAERTEAKELARRLRLNGERLLALVEPELPVAAIELLDHVSEAFKGSPLGRRALEQRRNLKRDRSFVAELTAARLQRKLLELALALQPCARCGGGGGSFGFEDEEAEPVPSVSLTCAGCRQNNRRLTGALAAGFKRARSLRDTAAGQQIERLEEHLTKQAGVLRFGQK